MSSSSFLSKSKITFIFVDQGCTFSWTKAALLRPEFDCERTRTFLSSVTLVRAMASERSPVVCLLLRSGARAAFGEQAMMILSPLADVPVVAFVSLRKLGIPNCPKPGMFVSTLSRLHLRSASVTECEIIPRTCLIMVSGSVLQFEEKRRSGIQWHDTGDSTGRPGDLHCSRF